MLGVREEGSLAAEAETVYAHGPWCWGRALEALFSSPRRQPDGGDRDPLAGHSELDLSRGAGDNKGLQALRTRPRHRGATPSPLCAPDCVTHNQDGFPNWCCRDLGPKQVRQTSQAEILLEDPKEVSHRNNAPPPHETRWLPPRCARNQVKQSLVEAMRLHPSHPLGATQNKPNHSSERLLRDEQATLQLQFPEASL